METRLSLRRRLLRIDDSPATLNSTISPSGVIYSCSNQSYSSTGRLHPQQEFEDEDDGENDGDEDADDEESGDDAEMNSIAGVKTVKTLKPGQKCSTAPVAKLVFSRSDPLKRSPTVCFDYPPSLGVVRDYSSLVITTVDAQTLALFYRTSWERNCVKNAFAAAGLFRTRKKWTAWHLAWAKPVPKTEFDKFRGDHPQVFNHFPDPWVVGRKDRLMKMLSNCRRRFGASYDFFPEGFSLPDQLESFRRALERNEAFITGTFPSIVENSKGSHLRVVVVFAFLLIETLKYVSDPLLLGDGERYKFDLRLGHRSLLYRAIFLKNPRNRFAHLTNYAINKSSKGFVENADAQRADAGSKWSLTALIRALQSQQLLDDPETLMSQIRAIVCKTIIAAEAHLTPLFHQFAGQSSCFELFGFDLMLDSKLRPWLIEVNVSPSLMGGSPLDRRVKGLLLSDTFHLVGLQVPITSVPRENIPVNIHAGLDYSPVT
ncbi:Tubulin polyglutamylase TTLL-4 [Phytophthora cactorum]|nr:Tubulin polyglutamylase TTLL-4 [Phytophthora cactorum]